jgi:L-iditol 2-dehydrogenase
VGARVRGFAVGDRVALHHHVPCRDCHFCRHGAFAQCATYKRTGITAGFEPAGGGYAEYVRVMSFVLPGVVKIPGRNSFLEGAMLEPVNTVLKAVERLRVLPGDAVLVAGQGPIGLMFTRLLALRGVAVLATDLMPERLAWARRFGARWTARGDAADLADSVARWTRRRGLDAAVVAVPSDAVVQQSLALVRGAGQILLFAHTKRGAMTEVDAAAELVFGRELDVRPLITHQLPLAETAAAVALASRPQPTALKVVVTHPAVDA